GRRAPSSPLAFRRPAFGRLLPLVCIGALAVMPVTGLGAPNEIGRASTNKDAAERSITGERGSGERKADVKPISSAPTPKRVGPELARRSVSKPNSQRAAPVMSREGAPKLGAIKTGAPPAAEIQPIGGTPTPSEAAFAMADGSAVNTAVDAVATKPDEQ